MARTMICLIAFVLLSSKSNAFEFFKTGDGAPLCWDLASLPDGAIRWHVAADAPPMLREAALFATQVWSDGSGGAIRFAEGEGGISIRWCPDGIGSADAAQAVLSTVDWRIVGVEITVNARDYRWSRGEPARGEKNAAATQDLDAVLTHEFGHTLGLNHSDIAGGASAGAGPFDDLPTMNHLVYPSAKSLHLDDITGLRALYESSDAPLPELYVAASPLKGRAPLNVYFVQVGGSEGPQWDFGDGSVATELAPVHRFTAPGTYTVTAVLNGMRASLTIEVVKKGRKVRPPRRPRPVR